MPEFKVIYRRPATAQAGSIGFVSTENEQEDTVTAFDLSIDDGAVIFRASDRTLIAVYSLRYLVKVFRTPDQ